MMAAHSALTGSALYLVTSGRLLVLGPVGEIELGQAPLPRRHVAAGSKTGLDRTVVVEVPSSGDLFAFEQNVCPQLRRSVRLSDGDGDQIGPQGRENQLRSAAQPTKDGRRLAPSASLYGEL